MSRSIILAQITCMVIEDKTVYRLCLAYFLKADPDQSPSEVLQTKNEQWHGISNNVVLV